MEERNQNSHIYWNPYFGGFLLGLLIILTFYITGRGLGASGAMKSTVVTVVETTNPNYAEHNEYLSKFIKKGESPMNNWLVYETLGMLIGAFISGGISGRIALRTQHSPKITSKTRLVFAGLGGILFGIGSQFGRGCSSGAALSGTGSFAFGGFLVMIFMFGTGYAAAWFFRKLWI